MDRFVLALGLILAVVSPASAQERRAVDLELALLVDVSSSVNDSEFRLQADGLAAAFRAPAVRDALARLARRGVAVSVIQWANHANQRTSVDWTLLRGDSDTQLLAARIETMPRLDHRGHTAIGSALAFALEALETSRFTGLRRVIDVSGDGRANDGVPLHAARDRVLERGVTVNGLAILNELPHLDRYFRKYLIGGEGSFVMVARDYADFAAAMTRKLLREIDAAPLAGRQAPNPPRHARLAKHPGP
ncbi:MAG: DUF1194 domain-containing protein [Alphaproteobacteria bacterium]